MRKIILTFLIFIAYSWYAFWECSIESGTPEELKEYLQNISIITNNINNNWKKISIERKSKLSDIEIIRNTELLWDEILRMWNISSEWWSEYDFDFKNLINELKEIERVTSVDRDLRIIDSYLEKISKYISNSTRDLYWWEILKKEEICKNTKIKCDIDDSKINVLLINIKKDVSKIRKSILNKWKIEWWFLFDNEDKLKKSLTRNYKESNIEKCLMSKDSFWWKVNKSISEISLNDKNSQKGIQKWKDSWALLIWQKSDREIERKLLLNELRRQWVSEDNVKNMLSNLDNYNQNWWYSTRDNFLSNTFLSITSSLNRQANDFNNSLDKYFVNWKAEQVSIKEILETTKDIKKTESIKYDIILMYKTNISLISKDDWDVGKIMNKLAKIHTYIAKSITTLQKTIPISEKVCNDQCSGKWICTY